MKKIILKLFIFFIFFIPFTASAKETVRIYLFHSDSCIHCAKERAYLEELKNKYDNLEVRMFEIQQKESTDLLLKTFEKLDYSTNSLPFTVIGSTYYSGFNTNIGYKIEDTIRYYSTFSHRDIVGEILGIVPIFEGVEDPSEQLSSEVKLPFLGKVDPKTVSIPIVAIILGLIDGFNPCAMWVLLFLITALIGMKDRKKMWILGITFLVTSALVYLLFMVAWLSITLKMQEIVMLRLMIAIIALVAGTINLNSYFKASESGCNIVEDKKRKKIITYIKKFTSEKYFLLAILGIMGLAFMVNLIELACSAGLPLLFTQILAINHLSGIMYGLNIFIYIFFFLLDDIIIFIIAMITFKVAGISTKYTKYSHLIGGLIMLLIAMLMLFKPEWLMFNF